MDYSFRFILQSLVLLYICITMVIMIKCTEMRNSSLTPYAPGDGDEYGI